MAMYNPGVGFQQSSPWNPARTLGGTTRPHKGEDWAAITGTPIPAAADGKVVFSAWLNGYGNTVVLEHELNGQTVHTLYAHMDTLSFLKSGEIVTAGSSVGEVGATGGGFVTGPHLHFEISLAGNDVNGIPNIIKKGHSTIDPKGFDFGTGEFVPGWNPFTNPASWIGSGIGDSNNNGIPDIHESIKNNFNNAKITRPSSPIILDLDGDGVETIKEGAGAFFDHDANGFAESTGWVGADDGLLVRDIDGNGRIDSGRELFGSETLLSSGASAANGFEALTELDENGDGVISSGDAAYASLKIWKDLNGDGYTGVGELLTLAEAGVQSINIGYTASTEVDPNGNEHRQVGSYTKTDGSTATASDVWFQADRTNTIAEEWLNVSADIEALPDLQGWGNVYDLHQAMVRDTSGTLKDLVTQFSAATTTSQRENLVQSILYKWTGADMVDPASRGSAINAQKLVVLEAFMGEGFIGLYGLYPIVNAADYLQTAYNDLFENTFAQLAIQTNLKPYFDKISYSWDESSQKLTLKYEVVATEIATLMANDNVAGSSLLVEVSRALHGVTGKGLEVGSAMDDVWGESTASDSIVFGMGGNDTIYSSSGDTSNFGGDGNDTITDSYGSDTIEGGDGNDVIVDQANGDNVLRGGAGNDIVTFSCTANNVIEGGTGDDLVRMDYQSSGMPGFANTIIGGTGDDKLSSGGSADTFVFNRGDGQDTINDYDRYSLGATDKLVFGMGILPSDLVISRMGDHLLIRVIDPTNPVIMDQITIENWIYENQRIEHIAFADGTVWDGAMINASILLATPYADIYSGSGDADIYDGMAGDDQIYGFDGNDHLSGGVGNDLIDGGSGDDVMSGGLGDDTYNVDSATDIVTELPGEGVDTVLTLVNYTLASDIENLTFINYWRASIGTGNELNNLIIGNMYDNTLDGAQGQDQLVGGAGNDTYIVDSAGDVIVENPEDGIDVIQSSVTYTLGENIENLTLTGLLDLNGTGNTIDNSMVGNDGNNLLNGGAGNDVLNGLAGGDTLIGGTGDDTYVVSDAGDVVIENAGDGVDVVQSSIAYTLGANLENLTLTGVDAIGGTGNNLDNVLLGNGADNVLNAGAGNDTLDGGYGNDTMIGGVGNDTYYVDATADLVTESANEGVDTIRSSITYTLGTNLESLGLLEQGGAINGTGNSLNNALVGNSSNNTLNGAAGTDTMSGGVGNDIYVVDNVGDIVIESLGEGTDTVQSSQTYTLSANVEKLTLTGSAAISGYGNALDNTLTGNSGANVLTGGLGNDTYVIGVMDTVVENAAEGVDVVQAAFSYTLTANTENLTLTGTTAINGTGNALGNNLTGNGASNILTGLDGNDWLDGKAGADTLVGGLGDDTYVVDNVGDVVTEISGDAADTVNSSITYTLGTYVENLTLTGSVAINGTGNASDNILTGNTGANVLTGGAGNDALNGGAGADTLIGGAGDDTYVVDNVGDVVTEGVGEGADMVRSSVSLTLGANVENLVLTGTSAINGTGNALDNLIIGNAAANTLNGSNGNDVLQGVAGNDILTDTAGNNLLDGGAGADTLTGNAGSELFVGGLGNDTITTNTGFDVIAINKGDGADILNASTGADNTLSLGGGIKYADLTFSKSGNNLILKTGGTDQVALKDWYASASNHSVLNLQIIAEAMADFAPGGSDVLKDNKVETFSFDGLVGAFDTARTATPTLVNWALTNALMDFHLSGSDSNAIGGDLAYQYGKNSSLTGIGLNATQSVISSSQFGQTAQAMNAPSVWQAELVKLS